MLTNEESLRLYSLWDFFSFHDSSLVNLTLTRLSVSQMQLFQIAYQDSNNWQNHSRYHGEEKNWMNNESEWKEKSYAKRKIHLRLLNCRWLFISGKQLKFLLVLASNERANIQKTKLYPAVIWRRRFWLYQSSSAHFLYLSLGFVAICGCIRARTFFVFKSLSRCKKVSKRTEIISNIKFYLPIRERNVE